MYVSASLSNVLKWFDIVLWCRLAISNFVCITWCCYCFCKLFSVLFITSSSTSTWLTLFRTQRIFFLFLQFLPKKMKETRKKDDRANHRMEPTGGNVTVLSDLQVFFVFFLLFSWCTFCSFDCISHKTITNKQSTHNNRNERYSCNH